MYYLSSFFGGGQETQEKNQLTKEQKDFVKFLKNSNGVFKVLEQHDIEDILCLMVPDIECSKIIKKKDGNGQDKKCEFLNCVLTFKAQTILEKDPEDGEDIQLEIPMICAENTLYEAD